MTIKDFSEHVNQTREECERAGTALALLIAVPICISKAFNRHSTDEDNSKGAVKPQTEKEIIL